MAKPADQVDLSAIHPLKRVTLIVWRLMFVVSLVIALEGQFVTTDLYLTCPESLLQVISRKDGINLVRCPYGDAVDPWRFTFYQIQRPGANWPSSTDMLDTTASIPGLFVGGIGDHRYITIHYLWLIGTSAALYLITRWRIRRTARLLSLPS